jgi:hypothetical protein
MSSIVVHAEIAQCKQECNHLQAQIEECVNQWYHITTTVRDELTEWYSKEFGKQAELIQRLALQDAELFRRVELLTIKVERGETLTPEIIELINIVVDKEYARYYRRLHDAFASSIEDREYHARIGSERHDDAEMVDMYRKLVKVLHPDATGSTLNQLASGQEMWHAVQAAYKTNNAAQLRSLLVTMGVTQQHEESRTLEQWQQLRTKLQATLRLEKRKLQHLLQQEPFSLEQHRYNAEWCDNHRHQLEQTIMRRRKSIEVYQQAYNQLVQEIAPDRLHNSLDGKSESSNVNVDQMFMSNTYFQGR